MQQVHGALVLIGHQATLQRQRHHLQVLPAALQSAAPARRRAPLVSMACRPQPALHPAQGVWQPAYQRPLLPAPAAIKAPVPAALLARQQAVGHRPAAAAAGVRALRPRTSRRCLRSRERCPCRSQLRRGLSPAADETDRLSVGAAMSNVTAGSCLDHHASSRCTLVWLGIGKRQHVYLLLLSLALSASPQRLESCQLQTVQRIQVDDGTIGQICLCC